MCLGPRREREVRGKLPSTAPLPPRSCELLSHSAGVRDPAAQPLRGALPSAPTGGSWRMFPPACAGCTRDAQAWEFPTGHPSHQLPFAFPPPPNWPPIPCRRLSLSRTRGGGGGCSLRAQCRGRVTPLPFDPPSTWVPFPLSSSCSGREAGGRHSGSTRQMLPHRGPSPVWPATAHSPATHPSSCVCIVLGCVWPTSASHGVLGEGRGSGRNRMSRYSPGLATKEISQPVDGRGDDLWTTLRGEHDGHLPHPPAAASPHTRRAEGSLPILLSPPQGRGPFTRSRGDDGACGPLRRCVRFWSTERSEGG